MAKIDYTAIIQDAVEAGMQAARNTVVNSKEAYRQTEQRLYALPILSKKVERDKELLYELQTHGSKEQSKSLVRFRRSGYRVAPEEMLEARILDLESQIANDEYEINVVIEAMEEFRDDEYYVTVTGKYIDRMSDEELSLKLMCSTSVIWRQRLRIVKDIAVLLYGTGAL